MNKKYRSNSRSFWREERRLCITPRLPLDLGAGWPATWACKHSDIMTGIYTCMSEFIINETKKEKRWCCWLIDYRHQTLDLHICHAERVTRWYTCIHTFLFGFSVFCFFLTLSLPKSLRCWCNAFQKEYCTWANPNRNIHFLEPIFSWACVNCQNSDCPMMSHVADRKHLPMDIIWCHKGRERVNTSLVPCGNFGSPDWGYSSSKLFVF